mgnify:CR=1 FL=1
MHYFFTLTSGNAKTGNIPQVYAQRSTCPPWLAASVKPPGA